MDLATLNEPRDANPRNISNSEVIAFLACQRAYIFAFINEIAPFITPPQLARGSVGHYFFELYWRARMQGHDHDASVDAALQAFINPPENTTQDVLLQAQYLCMKTVDHWRDEWQYWEPLGVEEVLHLPLTKSLNLTIKYDLYYRDIRTGRCKILDWKFSYDFWQLKDHDTNPQMPKYIGCMRANNYQVDEGVLFEIRTRPLGPEKAADPKYNWRETTYRPSKAKMRAVMSQHVATSLRIEKFRALSPEDQVAEAIPVLNKFGPCKYCNFVDLCNSMNEGKTDLTVDIRVNYKKNTYGYNKDDENSLEGL